MPSFEREQFRTQAPDPLHNVRGVIVSRVRVYESFECDGVLFGWQVDASAQRVTVW